MRNSGRKQTQRCNQHGHHDRPKPQNGAFHRGFLDRVASGAKLIDVFQHDDAGLHRHSEERQKTDSRRNAEVGVRDQQRQQPADAGHRYVGKDQERPLHRLEHGVEDDEDQQDRDRQHDQQPPLASASGSRIRRPSRWCIPSAALQRRSLS